MSVYQPEIRKPTEDYPRMPLDPELWTTSAITVPFFQKYPDYLILDTIIVNLDTTNSLSIKINNGQSFTLGAGATIVLSNVIIWKIEITPNNTTGNGFIAPFGILKSLVV
jgi:hypothetical protein